MVGNGVGAGSESGLELEISSTLAFPSRISISGLSHLNYTLGLVWTRGADYQTEFGQRSVNPFGSLATPLEFSSRACLALANCQLGTEAEEPLLLLLLLLRFTGRDATISPNGRLTWPESRRGSRT